MVDRSSGKQSGRAGGLGVMPGVASTFPPALVTHRMLRNISVRPEGNPPPAIAPITLEDGGSVVNTSSTSDLTFSGVDIGTATSDRIVVVMHGADTHLPTDIKIGGTSGTKIVELDGGGATASIWARAVTSGTTADIRCIFGSSTNAQGIYVAAMYGASISSHATATSNEDTPAPMTASLAIPAGGAAFGAACYSSGSGYQSFVWANLTEKADLTSGYTFVDFTMAQKAVSAAETPTITCTVSSSSASDGRCSMALASFAPG
jgi:hypothetical protein